MNNAWGFKKDDKNWRKCSKHFLIHIGPYDNIVIPRKSEKTDWEVELWLVIGKDARYLNSMEEAGAYIAGYCISNDVSERAFQLERGGQWTKGKSCDNFNPLGPYLATPEEVKDVHNLQLSLLANGRQMQKENTGNMILIAIIWCII